MNAVTKISAADAGRSIGADIRKLAQLADSLRRDITRLDKAWDELDRLKFTPAAVDAFRTKLEAWKSAGGPHALGRVSVLLKTTNNERYISDQGEPVRAEIAKYVALLVGSFPTANVPDPRVYTRLMVDDLADEEVCYSQTLDNACRRLRQTCTFLPAIAEVLKVVREEEELWSARGDAIYSAQFYIEDVEDELAKRVGASVTTSVAESEF